MASQGRRTKLTPEIEKSICDSIRIGNTFKAAAAKAGIDEVTFHRWMAKGEEGRAPYSQFRQQVIRAEADAETVVVGYWRLHIKDDWRAARDFLARRFPKDWKATERREHTGADGGPIGVAVLDDIMEGEEEE